VASCLERLIHDASHYLKRQYWVTDWPLSWNCSQQVGFFKGECGLAWLAANGWSQHRSRPKEPPRSARAPRDPSFVMKVGADTSHVWSCNNTISWSPSFWNRGQHPSVMLTLVSRYVPGQPDLGKGTSASVFLSLKANRLLWSPRSAGARYRPSSFYNSMAELVVWSLGCPNSNLVHRVCETQWPTRTGSDRLGHWAVQAHGPSHLCNEL
jgi:hypothetical protein